VSRNERCPDAAAAACRADQEGLLKGVPTRGQAIRRLAGGRPRFLDGIAIRPIISQILPYNRGIIAPVWLEYARITE
jgi:hypothetical protein